MVRIEGMMFIKTHKSTFNQHGNRIQIRLEYHVGLLIGFVCLDTSPQGIFCCIAHNCFSYLMQFPIQFVGNMSHFILLVGAS